jgi:hypothetical protein
MTQTPEPGSALAVLEEYERSGKVNVLRPVISIDRAPDARSPYLAETVQIVQIVPEVDTYHDFRYANDRDGLHALSGLGLAKIAAAAGVKWIPEECRVEERTRRPDGHVYIRYRAAGAIRQPNGEWHLEIATKDLDTAQEEEELREAYRRRAASGRGKAMSESDIEEAVRRDLLQLRKFLLGHAETKAKNRVIRRILALRQVYSTAELRRPFAVPRLVYRPDVAEANLRLEQHPDAGALGAGETIVETGPQPTTEEVDGTAAGPVSADTPTSVPGSETAPTEGEGPPSEEPADPTTTDAAGSEAPAQATFVAPERPKVDPEIPAGGKFSALASTDEGLATLREIAENSKAKARRDAALAWIAYAEGAR